MPRPRRALAAHLGPLVILAALPAACHRESPSPGASETTGDASLSLALSSPLPPTHPPSPPGPPDPCRVANGRQPLLFRWSPAQRDALESAMHAGIAVLAADDCSGLRLLSSCHARGRYGYLGMKPQAEAIDLLTDEELRVNAPLAGGSPPSNAGARQVHVALSVVGRSATTRSLLAPQELTGDCEGATHYVGDIEVGAAVVTEGVKGSASAIADACRAARPGDADPPARCRTILRARINTIAELGGLVTWDQVPDGEVAPIGTCPDPMVVSGLRCARPPVDAPFLCAFGDGAGCKEQCARGDVNSCDVLGSMFRDGKGVPKDPALSAAVYAKGCDRDDAIACANLSLAAYRGEGVARDLARSATLARKGCDLGSTDACGNLAIDLRNGEGVPADEVRGAALIQRACDAGSANACLQHASLWLAGADGGRARALLDELCDGDYGTSCRRLGLLTYLGDGVRADRARASALFTRACRTGDDEACVLLGVQYRQADGVPQDDVLATRLMGQACSHGHAGGCVNLGIAFENGKGIAKDTAHAARLYDEACKSGSAAGCLYFADCVRDGVGLAKDPVRAREAYAHACGLGEKDACAQAH